MDGLNAPRTTIVTLWSICRVCAMREHTLCPRFQVSRSSVRIFGHLSDAWKFEWLLEFVRVSARNVTKWCNSVGVDLDWIMKEQICAR